MAAAAAAQRGGGGGGGGGGGSSSSSSEAGGGSGGREPDPPPGDGGASSDQLMQTGEILLRGFIRDRVESCGDKQVVALSQAELGEPQPSSPDTKRLSECLRRIGDELDSNVELQRHSAPRFLRWSGPSWAGPWSTCGSTSWPGSRPREDGKGSSPTSAPRPGRPSPSSLPASSRPCSPSGRCRRLGGGPAAYPPGLAPAGRDGADPPSSPLGAVPSRRGGAF
ncbi:apoptosis regulator BAX isoform X2 [Ciconia boyciana]|uniref:apoptosis regulator BAX isoform X2 n=1 Tax=Ciconia boyciana TaxID=52775 RepID=UPI003BA24CF7